MRERSRTFEANSERILVFYNVFRQQKCTTSKHTLQLKVSMTETESTVLHMIPHVHVAATTDRCHRMHTRTRRTCAPCARECFLSKIMHFGRLTTGTARCPRTGRHRNTYACATTVHIADICTYLHIRTAAPRHAPIIQCNARARALRELLAAPSKSRRAKLPGSLQISNIAAVITDGSLTHPKGPQAPFHFETRPQTTETATMVGFGRRDAAGD